MEMAKSRSELHRNVWLASAATLEPNKRRPEKSRMIPYRLFTATKVRGDGGAFIPAEGRLPDDRIFAGREITAMSNHRQNAIGTKKQ